jgi:hypothetical protein
MSCSSGGDAKEDGLQRAASPPEQKAARKQKKKSKYLLYGPVTHEVVSSDGHGKAEAEISVHTLRPVMWNEIKSVFASQASPCSSRQTRTQSEEEDACADGSAHLSLTTVQSLAPLEKEMKHVQLLFRANCDLSDYGDAQAVEKDRLLALVEEMMLTIGEPLKAKGLWFDWIDPMTGQPRHSPSGPSCFSETDAVNLSLGYPLEPVGHCSILIHPDWGAAVYPCSMVVVAEAEEIVEAVEAAFKSMRPATDFLYD